ncbi:MAG: efflux RND transporter permease subunit [Verrucomicrobiales bacterium]|nr:efflux RND transporter permease subunit [Verrucomicrobiales bacterium]
MEKLINWFCNNHVAANFMMVVIVALGVTTWFGLKKEIFPEIGVDVVLVRVPYPNATPEEVEKGVNIPIEEAIQDLDGIERLNSTAAQGMGVVIVEVATGYDVRDLMGDVKTRVDAIQNLAEETEKPVLEEVIIKAQVMSIAVSAQTDEKTLSKLTQKVRDGLLNYQGGEISITQAELAGVRDYEISIEISEQTLRAYGLTFDKVAAAVRASSLDLPGGSVRTSGGEVLIRTEAKRYSASEFATVTVVTRPDGSTLKLGDIATIRDGFEEVDISSRFDGRPAMLINVFRVGNEDTLKIADTVRKYVYEVAPQVLPEDVQLEIWRDESSYLRGRMELLGRNGLIGLVLVTVVLALFLRPSLALLVALGIPVSFAGAIFLMPITGISINMISLFAFILVLGIVVDDAIVIGENVYLRIRNGEDPRTAAPRGTHEVGVVVIFGILTTMMAFTPMLGLSGVSGKIWPNIPYVVIPTLFFSLIQSKLVLPAHLAMLKPYDPNAEVGWIHRIQRKFSHGLEDFVDRVYRPFLKFSLHNRYLVLATFVAVLIVVGGLVGTGWVRFTFFPKVEADIVSAKIEMAKGVPIETTERAVAQIEAAAVRLNEEFQDRDGNPIIKHMLASSGTQPFQLSLFVAGGVPKDSSLGEVTLELQSASNRDYTGEVIAARWRELTEDIPGAVDLTFQTEAAGGGNAIDLEISGPDLDLLSDLADEIKAEMAKIDGVIDISDSHREGKRELKLEILPAAEALGLRLNDVALQVRQGFYGEEIQRLQRGRDEVKVFVRYPENERKAISDLDQMKIRTRAGDEVPFSAVARASFGRSYASIQRNDRRRAITITADLDKAKNVNANEVVAALVNIPNEKQGKLEEFIVWLRSLMGKESNDKKGALIRMIEKHPQVTYSFEGEQKDQRKSVKEMGQKALLALLGMYVLMAIPLKSYIQPMIVMSAIPFGIVGAVLGHVVMGLDLSIMSMCGIVALSGVVVNDSLVLVDYVNRHRGDSASIVDAAWEAGARRFRPILLTSLTTFAGLTPMLLETDIQAKFLIPMAVSLSFGILFATAITLILVPSIYLMLDDALRLLRRIFGMGSKEV